MKHLAILFALLTFALYVSACVAGERPAPTQVGQLPLAPTATIVPQPTAKVIEVNPQPVQDTEPSFYFDPKLPADVIGTFRTLTLHYPGSSAGLYKIVAVRYPRIGWAANIEGRAIYVNLGLTHCSNSATWCVKGKIDHRRALAYRYAQQRIWPMWKRNGNITDTRQHRTWQRFAAALAAGVR